MSLCVACVVEFVEFVELSHIFYCDHTSTINPRNIIILSGAGDFKH